MFDNQRAALALIATISGVMGFVMSMMAVPAGSTALAANALVFVQHSISAGFSLWILSGTITRPRWTVQLQGGLMMVLGILVCAIAVRRFIQGSVPHPAVMMMMGSVALGVTMLMSAIMLRHRGALAGVESSWRLSRNDAVGNIAVIAAGAAVLLTGSNIPDLVIGAVMAALFALASYRIAVSGEIVDRRS